jgi:hypothetical protein
MQGRVLIHLSVAMMPARAPRRIGRIDQRLVRIGFHHHKLLEMLQIQ